MNEIKSYPGEGVSDEEWTRIFPPREPKFFCENCGWRGILSEVRVENTSELPYWKCPKCGTKVIGDQMIMSGNKDDGKLNGRHLPHNDDLPF